MRKNPTDDELLRSYLLGELPEEEADRLELRLLEDDDLFELGEAVEADLLAAYARGGLPADKGFRRLTASPGGRERFALAKSLNAAADESLPSSRVIPFRRRFSLPNLAWGSLAAAGLLMTVWLALPGGHPPSPLPKKQPSGNPIPIPPPIPPARPSGENPEPPPEPRKPIEPRITRSPEPVKATVATVELVLRTVRGSKQPEKLGVLDISTQTGLAVIELSFFDEQLAKLGPFHATVRNAEKNLIWEKDGLNPKQLDGSPTLVLKISANDLPEGDYKVVVTAGTEEVGTASFTVSRKDG